MKKGAANAMKRRILWSACAMVGWALCCFAAEQQMDAFGAATAAPFKKAPVIDGKVEAGEWDGAVRTSGFQMLFGAGAGMLEPRTGTSYFGFTPERLYIAVVSEYPPDGKDHSSGTARDKDYIFDESIEIWLDPNRDRRQSQQGDLRFYQMIANAQGGIYDISFDPKTGPNTGWNGNWEFANSIDHERHVWTAELSLPFADIGWKPNEAIGKTVGVLIARNFKAPWEQATWFPVTGAFVDWYRYAAIHLTKDAPSVQITSLGENVHKGELQLRATIANPGTARKAVVNLFVASSDMPELKETKEIDLPAGGSVEYAFDVPPNRLHETAQHSLSFDVVSPDGNTTYIHYRLKWSQEREKKWHYRVGPDPEAAVRFAYYPSYKFVRLLVDTRELGKEPEVQIKSGKLVITGPDGKEVLNQRLAWDKPPFKQEFQVGDLADGSYKLVVTLDGWKEPFERSFKRIHFPWEGNKLGITDEVVPPFTPVSVKGNTVSVVFRGYVLDGLGLWKSVKASGNVSAGGPKELLAAPMVLRVNDGESLAGTGEFTRKEATEAVYEGRAQHSSVTVKTRCITEVDGCTRVELSLLPGTKDEELRALWLEVPLVDELMPLWHVSTTALRINPAGATPRGEGVVWDSRDFPDGNWYGNFKCYLWLGAEERGFCWFADNDAGWVLNVDEKDPARSVPCQQLIRKDGVLTLRVNLVQKPVKLVEPRNIVFGIMASPAKPMRADWRQTEFHFPSVFNMGYATPATYCAKSPWGNDFAIADWCYARRTGKEGPSQEEMEAWKERNFPKDMDPEFRDGAIKLAVNSFLGAFRPGQKYYKMYFDEFHTTAQTHPESHVFQSEWSGEWYRPLLERPTKQDHKMWGIGVSGIVASHRDFACWYGAEWVKRGIGLYFDNAFPSRAYDTLTTAAYKLAGERVQPSAGMWARREYLKRIWVIHRQFAPPDALPAMMIHMTNTHIIPYMVWNDENLDLEWKFGPEPQQSKFHHEFLRAESLGRQSGNVPYVIDKVMDARTAEENHIAHRTKFGAMMVHEIRWWGWGEDVEADLIRIVKDFGYGLDDCQVFNYWDDGFPVKASDAEAKSLLLKRNGELLLVVCTWNPNPAEVKFAFDAAALGMKPATAEDAERASCLPVWTKRVEEARAAAERAAQKVAAAEEALGKAADDDARQKAARMLESARAEAQKAATALSGAEQRVKSYGALALSWDAAACVLTIPMEGFGVRIVRLK
jgi:hypothetical protein